MPSLEQMFELVDDVKDWLHGGDGRERVVALHCKGGKGRTGTMICAILIDKGLFKVKFCHFFIFNLKVKQSVQFRKQEILFSTLVSGGQT